MRTRRSGSLDQTDPKIPVLEARLQAGLMRAALMRNSLANVVRGLHNEKIVNAEAEFVRATTGGDFGVHNRKASRSSVCNGAQLDTACLGLDLTSAHRRPALFANKTERAVALLFVRIVAVARVTAHPPRTSHGRC